MKPRTILIIIEDELSTKSLSTYFHGNGYRVEISRSLSDAIRKIRNGNINVVLLEDEIEGVNACDVVPIFKRINKKIQIIVISGDTPFSVIKCLRDEGIFYHAIKPLDLEEIKSAVKCAFQKVERENPKEWYMPLLLPRRVPA